MTNASRIVYNFNSVSGGWVDTHHNQSIEQEVAEMKLEEPEAGQVDEEDEVALDMDEFEAAGLLDAQDDTTLRTVPQTGQTQAGGEIMQTRYDPPDCSSRPLKSNLEFCRTYDLHITYDKFYQTPRLFLVGYDEVSVYNFTYNLYL